MKFFCEYCGNMIDANEDDKCPNCGAAYNKNKKYIKLEEERNKDKEINRQNKQKIVNHAIKFSKWILIIPIGTFLIGAIIFIIIFVSVTKVARNMDDKIQSDANSAIDSIFNSDLIQDQISSSEEVEEKEVIVGFNEYGSTTKYKVKVEKYETIEDVFGRAEAGYEFVKFHLLVENLTDDEIDSEDVNCMVDGIAQNNKYSGHSDLPFDINKGLTVKGTATFEVPINATSYDIKYGDYITIHIER